MIAHGDRTFVDTGAWIALAKHTDPLHPRARASWDDLLRAGARLYSSIPVAIETFTFLDRRGSREMAERWRTSLAAVPRFEILPCAAADLEAAWRYFDRKELHKLSLVDATSFVLMRKRGIRLAFTFDTHFHLAGFRCVA